MRKLYGDNVRQDAGLTRMLKRLARTNARLLESSAGKHGPELSRVAREVRETLEKVVGETSDAVDQLLAKCRHSCFLGLRETLTRRSASND